MDFIEIYDNALNQAFCDRIIQMFEHSSLKKLGVTGEGLDFSKKQSKDLPISLNPQWKTINQAVTQITLAYLVNYMRRYSHLLTGVLSPKIKTATGEEITVTAEDIPNLSDKAIANLIAKLYYIGIINAQKYEQGIGGYYHYHSEIYPAPFQKVSGNKTNNYESLHRVLLFMYYLNDVAIGGETEFYYQKRFITPKTGRLVIAPAGFTHTHKGHIPQANDKYILTSWVLFQPAEYLYALS
jgi:2OG-Fe(II) oxygenase superfamily